MHILITNDDGIGAPGIAALCRRIAEFADVTVAAPSLEQSGASQAITVRQPIRVNRHDYGNPRIRAWSIGGTPADCVKLALAKLVEAPPDFVCSGINSGANLGTDVLYSGTVSAAREGAMHGIPSVAFSLAARDCVNFAAAADFAGGFMTGLQQRKWPRRLLLNVNIPREWEQGGRVRFSRLGVRAYENVFEERKDPWGNPYYWMGGSVAQTANAEDSDIAVVQTGAVSITPLHFETTDEQMLEELRQGKL